MVFKGGVHPNYNKITAENPIEKAKLPIKVVLPISQHIGAPCEPLVKVGDNVKTGQKIAESSSFTSAPIHSSISGEVKSIENSPHTTTGKPVLTITIESDGKDEKVKMEKRKYDKLSKKELLEIIKEAGIVGMGGACFPTHVKLSPPEDKPIDTLIINGAECEPYLTTDHRVMIEKADELIEGIKIIQKILEPKNTIIGIEGNKSDAIKKLKEKSKGTGIKVFKLKTKYPQGGEKMLIYSINKRIVPECGLPMDIGCVVQNIGTAVAIYEAVALSKPLYERVITVTGKVNQPKNIMARIGTLMSELIEQAGDYAGDPVKLINGGPMMGQAMPTDELPVLKGTSGLTVFNKQDIDNTRKEIECIRCGACVHVCPMNLNPTLIARYAEKGRIDLAEKAHALSCIECGCCSYVCPSNIPLLHWIKYAKAEICNKGKTNNNNKTKK